MNAEELEAKWSSFLDEYATVIGFGDDESFIPIPPGNARALALFEETARRFGHQPRRRVYGWRPE